MLSDLSWIGDDVELKRRIVVSGAGFHNKRTEYISAFTTWYWDHPDWFWYSDSESWIEYRDRIRDAAPGIGRAKSSFVVEMTYPSEAQVICTDTHVMQIYGWSPKQISLGKVPERDEAQMEQHWVAACKDGNVPPVIARWVYWDKKQNYSDPRYWSFVFEEENYHDIFKEVAAGNNPRTDV